VKLVLDQHPSTDSKDSDSAGKELLETEDGGQTPGTSGAAPNRILLPPSLATLSTKVIPLAFSSSSSSLSSLALVSAGAAASGAGGRRRSFGLLVQ
jgi:hypothetical protein